MLSLGTEEGEHSDGLSVWSLAYPGRYERLMQLCAVGSNSCSPWLFPSEECLTYVLRDVGLECEFVPRQANRKRENAVDGVLSLELVLTR